MHKKYTRTSQTLFLITQQLKKIQAHSVSKNDRLDFNAIRAHFLGVGINSIDVIDTESTLDFFL